MKIRRIFVATCPCFVFIIHSFWPNALAQTKSAAAPMHRQFIRSKKVSWTRTACSSITRKAIGARRFLS